ncbi:MAG TPA: dihydrolipoamide acetyltransferase family protein [Anaerolineales bacterium]|nr:dihydrolipoamide acetyltransferase family protein [Anaerolineales bacterium]
MATEVIMPQLGESVVEGTVTKWLKTEGQTVQEFEPLLEINTDKVDTEIPSPASGVLLKVYTPDGQTVRAGTVLAVIGETGEAVPAAPAAPSGAHAAPVAAAAKPAAAPAASAAPARGKADLGFISPVVAKMAAEYRIDLAQVRGTGAGGRITKKDVLDYVRARASGEAPAWEQPASGELFRPSEEVFGAKPSTAAAPAAGLATATPGQTIPHDAVRRTIAEHMLRSRRTSPHVTTVMEADMSRVIAHRAAHKDIFARDGVDLTFTSYFVLASVAALKAVPWVNASWSDEGVVLHRAVNVGVAVSLGEQGLIVPVIKDADQKSLLAVAAALKDLAMRARARQLKPDEVQGGTFTITNHGVSGSLMATPIINQPQCGILGVGAMQKRVVAVETITSAGEKVDAVAVRPMVYITLTFDHRIIDGAVADRFLAAVVERLQTWS